MPDPTPVNSTTPLKVVAQPDPTQPAWYQSTLLWGSASLAATIVLTVVAVMTKDPRSLLVLAWPFSWIAVWEFVNYFPYLKKRRTITTIGAALVFAVALYSLNLKLKPEVTPTVRNQTSPLPPTTVPTPPDKSASPPQAQTSKRERDKPSNRSSRTPAVHFAGNSRNNSIGSLEIPGPVGNVVVTDGTAQGNNIGKVEAYLPSDLSPKTDVTKAEVAPLDPNDPNYELLKRGCPVPQPGAGFYICHSKDSDIHDNHVYGAPRGPAFELYDMANDRIWNNSVEVNGEISAEDRKLQDNLVAQYRKEHPGLDPDQQLVDWINAQLKERGRQFQVHLTAPKNSN